MRIHVISTGNEILRGHTLNTNLAFIGDALERHGYSLDREVAVPDATAAIRQAVLEALSAADVVITIGGLGPTSDDVTRDVVAAALGLPLQLDEQVLRTIQAFLGARSRCVSSESMRVQAMVPQGAVVLENPNGTAPGLWCRQGGKVVVMLPGPPRELMPMFTASVLPRLAQVGAPSRASAGLNVCGVPEPTVAETVEAVLRDFPGVTPAYCVRFSGVDVYLTTAPDRAPSLDAALARVRAALGHGALPSGCSGLAEDVGRLLRERGLVLAVAESCTGGSLAAAVTSVPGASEFFQGGVVSYANEWKVRLLGVREETLAQCGAVSAETAAEMLAGLLERHAVQAGVAITGIAGPAGGSPEKPVGLVFIGTAAAERRQVRRYQFPGNRETIRQRAVTAALTQLRLDLLGAPMPDGSGVRER